MIDPAAVWETIRRQAPLPEGLQAALLVGSYARGWANEGSDVDVVVVATSQPAEGVNALPVPLDPPEVTFASGFVGSVGWEVKYWLAGQVEQMLEKVRWERYESNLAAAQSIIEQEELFLERLVTAVPLCGAEWLQKTRARLAESAFRTLVASRSLGLADKAVTDALGQAAAGDLVSAALSARSAYQHAVDGLLESHDTYGSLTVKWRARRVQEAALPELPFDDYWPVETMAGCDRADLGRWVADTIRRARRLMLATEVQPAG
jgi:hypothetical protein